MAENEGSAVDRLTYLLIGAGLGAAVALLFAPKAGHELRGDIADASKKGLDYTKQGAQLVGERATEIYENTTQKAQDIYGQTAAKAQDLITAGKEQVTSKREQLQSAIEAGKDAYAEEKQRGAGAPGLPAAPSTGGGSTGGNA